MAVNQPAASPRSRLSRVRVFVGLVIMLLGSIAFGLSVSFVIWHFAYGTHIRMTGIWYMAAVLVLALLAPVIAGEKTAISFGAVMNFVLLSIAFFMVGGVWTRVGHSRSITPMDWVLGAFGVAGLVIGAIWSRRAAAGRQRVAP